MHRIFVLHLDALGSCILEHVSWIARLPSTGRPSQQLVDEHDDLDAQLSCGSHYHSLRCLHAQMEWIQQQHASW